MEEKTNSNSVNPDIPWNLIGLGGGLATFVAGITCLLDDASDFGKMGVERDPPMPHHWLYGCLLICAGVAGLGFSLLDLLSRSPPPKLPKKLLPLSLEEQGATPEEVERVQKLLEIK